MTTTASSDAPTVDLLTSQLAEARGQVEEAEVAVGAATLDRKGQAAAEKLFEDATGEVRRLEAAIRLAENRTAEAEQQAAQDAAMAANAEIYDWIARHLPGVAEALQIGAALKAKEVEIRQAMKSCPRRLRTLQLHGSEKVQVDGVWTRRLLDETDLDFELIEGMPFAMRVSEKVPLDFGSITPERLAELTERAEQLAEACREGRHADVAVTGAQRLKERQEYRQQRADAYKAKLDRERKEAAKAKADRERAEVEKGDRRQESSAPDARQRELSSQATARGEQLADSGVAK